MVNKLSEFPDGRLPYMNWAAYADGSIYEFTPADGLYTDAKKFRMAARTWARRHGYAMTSVLTPPNDPGASVALRFTKNE